MALTLATLDEVTIRAAVPDDAAALAEFAEHIFRDTFECDNRPEDMAQYVATAFGTDLQRAAILDARGTILLAECGASIVGYARLIGSAPPAEVTAAPAIELERFYVAREWHGRGLAQRLMQHAIRIASRRDAVALWLCVWERNARAISFYGKMGFVDVGTKMFVLGTDQQPDRIMWRPIN